MLLMSKEYQYNNKYLQALELKFVNNNNNIKHFPHSKNIHILNDM